MLFVGVPSSMSGDIVPVLWEQIKLTRLSGCDYIFLDGNASVASLARIKSVPSLFILGNSDGTRDLVAGVPAQVLPATHFPESSLCYFHVCNGKGIYEHSEWRNRCGPALTVREKIWWVESLDSVIASQLQPFVHRLVGILELGLSLEVAEQRLRTAILEERRSLLLSRNAFADLSAALLADYERILVLVR